MAVRRSRLLRRDRDVWDADPRPRLRLPLVPTLVGTLAVLNIASAVLALIQ